MDSARAIDTLFPPHPPPKSRAMSALALKSSSLHYSELRPTRHSQPLLPLVMDSSTTPQTTSPPPFPSKFHSSFRISSIPTPPSSLINSSYEHFSNSAFPLTGPGPVALVTFPVQPSEPAMVTRASTNKPPKLPPKPIPSLSVPPQAPPSVAPKLGDRRAPERPVKRQVPVSRPPPLVRRGRPTEPAFPTEPPKIPSRSPILPPISYDEPSRELEKGFIERPPPGPGMSRFSAPPSRPRDLSRNPEARFEEFPDEMDESLDVPSTPNMNFDPTFASTPIQRIKVTHDPFFSSNLVIALNTTNFTQFLGTRDAVAVMFYDSKLPESRQLEKVVSQAASSTKRAGHTYAGVDCSTNLKLCMQYNAKDLPMVRVYSKLFCLGELKKTVSADALRQRIEMAPPAEALRMVSCSPCV